MDGTGFSSIQGWKGVSFSPNDAEITEIASEKLIAKGLANHHAKAYEFSHFVADAKPTTLLTHGNEVSRLWHERFGHINFKYSQQLQKNSMVEGLPVSMQPREFARVV